MSVQIMLVFILTFVIYVIATLAYSVRIVGVRTGRIAVAFAVFNVFALVSRMAGTFQTPLLSNIIEKNIHSGSPEDLLYMFRLILLSSTAAALVGILLMPTFIRIFSKAVESFSIHRSVPRLLIHGFSKSGIEQFKKSISIPKRENFRQLRNFRKISKKIVILNVIAFSISTVGSLAALYAGSRFPDFRATCNSLSSVVNGFSTLIMFIIIDPYVSIMTDDVIRGECSFSNFNRCIVFMVGGLVAGTVLAQLLLVPASELIRMVAGL